MKEKPRRQVRFKFSEQTIERIKSLPRKWTPIPWSTSGSEVKVSIVTGWIYVEWRGPIRAAVVIDPEKREAREVLNEEQMRFVQSFFSRIARGWEKDLQQDLRDGLQPDGCRPKEKEEVGVEGGSSNEIHGGSGASGEVPDSQSAGGVQNSGTAADAENSSVSDSSSGAGRRPDACASEASECGRDLSLAEEASELGSDLPELEHREGGCRDEVPAGKGTSDRSLPGSSAERDAGTDAQPSVPEGTGSHPGDWETGSDSPAEEALVAGDEEPGQAPESSRVPSPGAASTEDTEQAAALADGDSELEELPSARNMLRKWKSGSGSQNSTRSKMRFGGVFGSLERKVKVDLTAVRKLQQLFTALLHGGESEPSARWDARRVSIKTAGYLRSWTVNDRRHEDGRPAILVLPDVSGSMAAWADEVCLAAVHAAWLGVSGADVVVVAHSNGFPVQMLVNRSRPVTVNLSEKEDEVFKFYGNLLRRYQVRAVVIFADWDGEWLYRWLAELPTVERILWFDPYCCRQLLPVIIRRFPPKFAEGVVNSWSTQAIRKVRFAFAVASLEEILQAMARMVFQS